MEYENVMVEVDGEVGLLKINRPDRLNALNSKTLDELAGALEDVSRDESVKVVVITGQGKAFVAGADIAEMSDMDPLQARAFSRKGQAVLDKIEHLEKPVIAAVNGFALGGGCELALACDIRLASEEAKFGQPEVNLGVIPGFAGTQRLARLIGEGRAKEYIFTGETIDAQAALSYGLANKVVPAGQLMDEAMSLAEKITAKGPLAVSLAKTLIHKGLQVDLNSGTALETDAFALCFASGQAKEGMTAFLEKRKPVWAKGKTRNSCSGKK
jgi:enoyl-CoA hydratase